MAPGQQTQSGNPGPELRPPGAHPQPGTNKPVLHKLVWVALAVVIILGLLVILLLPKLVSGTGGRVSTDTPVQVVTEAPGPVADDSAKSRAKAEQALQNYLRTQARLELANAAAWGDPEWSLALEGADKGNDLFAQSQFSSAADVLLQSTELLLLLESERGLRLTNALDSGWQALQTDDSVSALIYFETARSIDAGNEDALNGLERARVRPDLLELMAIGEESLLMDDLQNAKKVYLDAVALDGAYEPASIALKEVSQQIDELAFRDAMSRALSALEAEQIEVSEAALQQAARLKPGNEVVSNTRQQLAQARQRLWLADQRRQAEADEGKEDWSAALAVYRNVLARVPQAGFASRGLAFAGDRERLHRQLDHYIKDPTRIYSEQPRLNAEKLIKSAGKPPAAETSLAEKIQRLQAIIIEAQTPLMITLRSDGLTRVQIYHVGRLGLFTTQQLELRPGTYTVVGSRPGYRDVRQTFTVKPGVDQPALEILCEETV
jgi:tetratricopeptide (TPR) repeat protein